MSSIFGTTKYQLELNENWKTYRNDEKQPVNVSVPGHVQYDMFKAGLLPDPFIGENCEEWQSACEDDYTYSLKFDVSASLIDNENVELVFEGIDTISEISLNGKFLGKTDNMFKTWRFSVKKIVKEKENELKVLIKAPRKAALEIREKYKDSSELLKHNTPVFFGQQPMIQNYIRKTACSFGWDWGPTLPLSGIWKSVFIEGWNEPRIKSIFVETKVSSDNKSAEVLGYAKFTGKVEKSAEAEIKLTLPSGKEFEINKTLQPEAQNVSFKFIVDNPPLWWPNGLGEQPLCTLTADLKKSGKSVSIISKRIGIRQLDMVVEPDKFGTSFFVRVNGVPVFTKGSNWIPADALTPRLTDLDYRRLISDAANANMNMLRIWGGGYYEKDVFYDLCDEFGILIWHDLMFACIAYPSYKEFLQSVSDEITDNICRLQSHPSIALWCGNNEVEMLVLHYQKLPDEISKDYFYLFDEYLRGVVNSLDHSRLYWPSSPHTPFSNNTDEESGGDTHFWGVWHFGLSFDAYIKRFDRFMSEFGYQAFPDIHTIKSFAKEDEMELESKTMLYHQKNPGGNARIMEDVVKNFGEPKNFPHFLIMSQFFQQKVIKTGVEHWRANRSENRCMGTIYWQFNDNWPVVSWASVDYNGRWKALHYSARKFYAPVLITAAEYEDELRVSLINDLAEEISGEIILKLRKYSGEIILEKKINVKIDSCNSKIVFAENVDSLLNGLDKKECYFTAEFINKKTSSTKILHFSTLKDAALQNPDLVVEAISNDEIKISVNKIAKYVYLECEDSAAQFSDNYFDILPGEKKIVKLIPVKKENQIDVNAYQSVTAISLYDLK